MSLTKIFLTLGITIIFAVFVNYTYTIIFPAPKYPMPPVVSPGENSEKHQEFQQNLKEYRRNLDKYNFQTFLILTILGIIFAVLGIFLATSKQLEVIGPAILGGGIVTILHGIARSWRVLSEYLKVVLLFLVLVFLIFLAYKKLEIKNTLTQKEEGQR